MKKLFVVAVMILLSSCGSESEKCNNPSPFDNWISPSGTEINFTGANYGDLITMFNKFTGNCSGKIYIYENELHFLRCDLTLITKASYEVSCNNATIIYQTGEKEVMIRQ